MSEEFRHGLRVRFHECDPQGVVFNAHYLAALRFDDEAKLVIRRITLGNTSMTTELAVERDGEPVAEGELRHVFVDGSRGATTPIPESVRCGLARYAG